MNRYFALIIFSAVFAADLYVEINVAWYYLLALYLSYLFRDKSFIGHAADIITAIKSKN